MNSRIEDMGTPFQVKEALRRALRAKRDSDFGDLRHLVGSCRRCPGGGNGLWGKFEKEVRILLIAGLPGPGASRGDPWGEHGRMIFEELERVAPEFSHQEIGLTVALRCPGVRLDARALRRCSQYLAEEIHLTDPHTIVAFGRPAAVALRMALGEMLPASPRAGEEIFLHGKRFVYNLAVSKLMDPKMGEICRRILLAAFKAR